MTVDLPTSTEFRFNVVGDSVPELFEAAAEHVRTLGLPAGPYLLHLTMMWPNTSGKRLKGAMWFEFARLAEVVVIGEAAG